jgi:hypothetical protein
MSTTQWILNIGLLAWVLLRNLGTGAAFAGLWIAVIGGRILFAEWANGSGSRTIGRFSVEHLITGAEAWTAAFVLMALAMVVARVVTTGLWAAASRRSVAGTAPAVA